MSEGNGDRSARFIGLTKVQFLGVAVALFAVITGIALIFLGAQIGENGTLARQAKAASDKNADLIHTVQMNSGRIEEIAQELKGTQCAQKEFAQKQVEATADLLASGRDLGGITRDDLIAALERQRNFRDTFQSVDCP